MCSECTEQYCTVYSVEYSECSRIEREREREEGDMKLKPRFWYFCGCQSVHNQ